MGYQRNHSGFLCRQGCGRGNLAVYFAAPPRLCAKGTEDQGKSEFEKHKALPEAIRSKSLETVFKQTYYNTSGLTLAKMVGGSFIVIDQFEMQRRSAGPGKNKCLKEIRLKKGEQSASWEIFAWRKINIR